MDDFNDEHFHVTGVEAILIFEGQICNCFTVPLSVDNSAYLSQLFQIVGEVNLQIFLNKIIVWFDAVTPKKNLVIEIIPSPSFIDKLTANFRRLYIIRYRPFEIKSERGKPEFATIPGRNVSGTASCAPPSDDRSPDEDLPAPR